MQYPKLKTIDDRGQKRDFTNAFINHIFLATWYMIDEKFKIKAPNEKLDILHDVLNEFEADEKTEEIIKRLGPVKIKEIVQEYFKKADELGILDEVIENAKPYINL